MSHLSMGAINKLTNQREIPRFASKANNYSCPECSNGVQLKQGKIRSHHFAHNKSENPCNYYNHPGESEIHKEAKLVIKTLIDNKKPMMFVRLCEQCNDTIEGGISQEKYNDYTRGVIEYNFKHNNKNKFADVAMLDGNNLEFIFEIYYKHKTEECNRPDNIDWFEIDAITLINNVNNQEHTDHYVIQCMRNMKCYKCVKTNKIAEHKRSTRIDKQTFYNNMNEQERLMNENINRIEKELTEKKLRDKQIKRLELIQNCPSKEDRTSIAQNKFILKYLNELQMKTN